MQPNMKKLVPIKILIGSKVSIDGTMPLTYPNFNQLDLKLRGNMDWSFFIDRAGYGMHYSSKRGNNKKPPYCWTLVPRDFAEAAAKTFAEVTIESEEAWEDFYDNDCKATADTERLDTDRLQAILARVQLEKLGIAPPPSKEIQALRKKCLDPSCKEMGINHNHRKTWAQAKVFDQIEIDDR